MSTRSDPVERHYGFGGLLATITGALREAGHEPPNVSVEELAPVDSFHLRGRESTTELVQLAELEPGRNVVDVGCGIGGTSRYLASAFGCTVTGVDLTPEFCEVARELSRWTGLDELTTFHCASALDLPLPDAGFDVAWTEHVQMNISDKEGLYREVARVVRPAGLLVFHDIFQGPGGEAHFPVPWAGEASLSHLVSPAEARAVLESVGFSVRVWRDLTEVSSSWIRDRIAQAADGPPTVGVHLLMGAAAGAKFANVARNLEERRIEVVQAVLERDGSG